MSFGYILVYTVEIR